MARIRSIKPEFWTSAQVVECSMNARLLFIGLWNFCDDAGRHPFKPKQIKMEIFPGDDISLDTVRGMIDELSANGLVMSYQVDGEWFLQVKGWHHQRIDKPQKPKYPDPPPLNSTNAPRTFPPDTIGEDRIGKERKESLVGERSPTRRRIPDGFRPETVKGFTDQECAREIPQFTDFHKSRGSTMLDWQAAFRTWMRNSRKFSPKGAGPPSGREYVGGYEIKDL